MSTLEQATGNIKSQLVEANLRVAEAEESTECLRRKYEHTIQIMKMESQGLIAHLKQKWEHEFDKRKNLHNTVSIIIVLG